MKIRGYLTEIENVPHLRKELRYYVPVNVLFLRDFTRLVELKESGYDVVPVLTDTELRLTIPRRIESLYTLKKKGIETICVLSIEPYNFEQLLHLLEEYFLEAFSVDLIVTYVLPNVERVRRLSNRLSLYLPICVEVCDLVDKVPDLGIVLSTQLYTRVKKMCVNLNYDIINNLIFRVKDCCRECNVIVDILGIKFHIDSE